MTHPNIIAVRRTPECITATFSGTDTTDILALFGTLTLPCPHATVEAAAAELRRNWPAFNVEVA